MQIIDKLSLRTPIFLILFIVFSGITMVIPIVAYANSDIQSENVFEHVMTIDIHDQSTVVYSFTETPILCEVEYVASENQSSESIIFSHSSIPHTAHIVKIPNLLPNTQYEYQFIGELDERKIYSEKTYFTTL